MKIIIGGGVISIMICGVCTLLSGIIKVPPELDFNNGPSSLDVYLGKMSYRCFDDEDLYEEPECQKYLDLYDDCMDEIEEEIEQEQEQEREYATETYYTQSCTRDF